MYALGSNVIALVVEYLKSSSLVSSQMLAGFVAKINAHTLRGRVKCPQKPRTLSRGQRDNIAYIPHEENTYPSANISAKQHYRQGS